MLQLSVVLSTLVAADLLPVVSLLGVVGNALNVAVFFRQGLRQRVNVCLFSLALADLVVCIHYFLLTWDSLVREFQVLIDLQQVRFSALVTFVNTKLIGGWRAVGEHNGNV